MKGATGREERRRIWRSSEQRKGTVKGDKRVRVSPKKGKRGAKKEESLWRDLVL